MKMLIATGLFSPDIGGPATYSKILLEKLPREGIETTILPFGAVRHLPRLLRHLVYFFRVLLAGRSVDVIYAQDPVSVGFPVFLASKVLKKPFLLKIVGDYAWEQGVQRFWVKDSLDDFAEKNNYSIFIRMLKYIETKVALGADRIIVPSKYLQKIVHLWGVPKSRITVIYNAFEGVGKVKSKEEARLALGLEREKVITSVSRLVPWKGFVELIELFPQVLHHFPDAVLYIIGEGPLWVKLEEMIKKLGLVGKVILAGKLPQTVAHNYMSASDVFVLNTSYEGFSHLLLEAMALSVPIVTTRVGGNPELIENKENGLLVSLGNREELLRAILLFLSDTPERRTVIHAGKETMRNFSEDRMISELLIVLKKYETPFSQ